MRNRPSIALPQFDNWLANIKRYLTQHEMKKVKPLFWTMNSQKISYSSFLRASYRVSIRSPFEKRYNKLSKASCSVYHNYASGIQDVSDYVLADHQHKQ